MFPKPHFVSHPIKLARLEVSQAFNVLYLSKQGSRFYRFDV